MSTSPASRLELVADGLSYPTSVAFDADGNAWYSDFNSQYFGKLDVKTGKVVEYSVPLRRPGQIAQGGLQIDLDKQGRVYYGNMSQLQIVRLDPKTGKMETFQLPTPEATWGDAHLTMIDPAHMDLDGKLWFNVAFDTGESGGTWRADLAKNEWTPIKYPQGSPSARAYDVIHARTMEYLLAHPGWSLHLLGRGLMLYNGKTFAPVQFKENVTLVKKYQKELDQVLQQEPTKQ